MSDGELIKALFFGNENVNMEGFTKLMELVHHKKEVRLIFGSDGVFADVAGVDGYILIYAGEFNLRLE